MRDQLASISQQIDAANQALSVTQREVRLYEDKLKNCETQTVDGVDADGGHGSKRDSDTLASKEREVDAQRSVMRMQIPSKLSAVASEAGKGVVVERTSDARNSGSSSGPVFRGDTFSRPSQR
jgi:hypothetical protein